MPKRKKRKHILNCDVCNKDLRNDYRKEHVGFCRVCRKKTRHTIPLHGFPWACVNEHPEDAVACRGCGKPVKKTHALEISSFRAGRSGRTYYLCPKCNPLPAIFGR